jgi:hypothetical protein
MEKPSHELKDYIHREYLQVSEKIKQEIKICRKTFNAVIVTRRGVPMLV